MSSATTRLAPALRHRGARRLAGAEEAGHEACALGDVDELADRFSRGSAAGPADPRARWPPPPCAGTRRCRPSCARSCCRPTSSSTTACRRRCCEARLLTSSTGGDGWDAERGLAPCPEGPPHGDEIDQEQDPQRRGPERDADIADRLLELGAERDSGRISEEQPCSDDVQHRVGDGPGPRPAATAAEAVGEEEDDEDVDRPRRSTVRRPGRCVRTRRWWRTGR